MSILLLTLAMSASSANIEMPDALRGNWDFPSHCKLNDPIAIVKRQTVVFGETVFTPKRVVKSKYDSWTAVGEYDDLGEISKGTLVLRLSRDGKTLSFTNYNDRIVNLKRCKKEVTDNAPNK